jgi:hypothetical protein
MGGLGVGFGGDGSGGGADEEPLGRSLDAAENASPFCYADGIVALASEDGGFGFFVGQVGLCCGELGLTGLAVEGEVVEGF